jgi:hypothetical protein
VLLVGVHAPTRYASQRYFRSCHSSTILVGLTGYRKKAESLDRRNAAAWVAARTLVARDAYDVLMQGGLVAIAGDEQSVANGVPAVIGDRLYRLTRGFAELAVATGAALLPYHSVLLADGRVRIAIAPPLVWDRSISRGSEQISAIVHAYACEQTRVWQQAPSAVSKEIMAQHLALPVAERKRDG